MVTVRKIELGRDVYVFRSHHSEPRTIDDDDDEAPALDMSWVGNGGPALAVCELPTVMCTAMHWQLPRQ